MPSAFTLDTINLATLGGKPFPVPIFAVTIAGTVLYVTDSAKSIILILGGLLKSYPSPPDTISILAIPPSAFSVTLPATAPEPGVVPSPI